MLKPPKSMFPNSITLIKQIPKQDDPYNDDYEEIRTDINNVRFNLRTVYSGSNNDRQIVANATVIFMPPYTNPWIKLDDSYIGSKIIFNAKEYMITTVNRDMEPFNGNIYQYKVGVI
ncbi:putative minor capsid protein [Lactobacillus crispatus]|uniref:Minor capsid protein n=1 Tax=Lactobacillus crispatus TaxID=47770 RepID=A0A6A1Z772_9LACO|nr:putative minor capsid protein [Lactobacillus crispatus]KAB1977223.1 minor capsid protein [Lactobacillus crispatus]MCT3538067.1 minor capsid protein [Lactobacillus crispatus]